MKDFMFANATAPSSFGADSSVMELPNTIMLSNGQSAQRFMASFDSISKGDLDMAL